MKLYQGDNAFWLDSLPSRSAHALVTDPPAGISFMGRDWDSDKGGRDAWIAWLAGVLRECRRILVPGGHALVWAIPRTSHWTAMALEHAGFEVRDVITHHFGTGFPKSLDVAKAIDKKRHDREQVYQVTAWIRARRDAAGLTNAQVDAAMGYNGMMSHWTSDKTQPAVPTLEQVPRLLAVLGVEEVPEEMRRLMVDLNGRKGQPGEAWFKREVIGSKVMPDATAVSLGFSFDRRTGEKMAEIPTREVAITRASSEDAKRWEGWGTALKPGSEHWILARVPLEGTVADNVRKHGAGALNIDATRIGTSGGGNACPGGDACHCAEKNEIYAGTKHPVRREGEFGRWPANLALSHSEECVPAGTRQVKTGVAVNRNRQEESAVTYDATSYAIPHKRGPDATYGEGGLETVEAWDCAPGCPIAELDEQSGQSTSPGKVTRGGARGSEYGMGRQENVPAPSDSGGASRFFYCPKPSRRERGEGNDHPTVKPINLMRWLVRLITPPGGVVLDPFAGSGTTGVAALLEGFDFVGIEQDPHFAEIAAKRLGELDL